jgi:hypothetical protein
VTRREELQRRVPIALGKSSQKVKECLKAAGQRNGTEENMGEEQRWVDGCSGRIKEWKQTKTRSTVRSFGSDMGGRRATTIGEGGEIMGNKDWAGVCLGGWARTTAAFV